MLQIKKDKGEIVFSYADGPANEPVQGRITYKKVSAKRIAFTMMAQTVVHFGDIEDVATLLMAIGSDLKVEGRRLDESETDGSPTEDGAGKTDPDPEQKSRATSRSSL